MAFVAMIWLVCSIACAILAGNKGRNRVGWFLLGLLLGPLAVFLALLVKVEDRERAASEAHAAETAATCKCLSVRSE